MRGAAILADFGSTYTKVSLVDVTNGQLLSQGRSPTSIGTDLMDGYGEALDDARRRLGTSVEVAAELAASSAGGGLRVAAVGLVEDLTAAAAKQAALNAGARICAVLAGDLDESDRQTLEAEQPEIVLFAGGTDGGQRDKVIRNAKLLASCRIDAFVVVACNGDVARQIAEQLSNAGHEAEVAPNVMPVLGRLDASGARSAIARAFITHVIRGKKLSARPEFEQLIQMATPDAVLRATQLLSEGTPNRRGIGDVAVLDIGGATTDVHSVRKPPQPTPGIEDPLLHPVNVVRTVEGDLGLRAGAAGVVALDGRWLEGEVEHISPGGLSGAATRRAARPDWIPEDGWESQLDRLLAVSCTAYALERHCGRMVLTSGQNGPPTLKRTGPDLRHVRRLIGTGGILVHGRAAEQIISDGLNRIGPRTLAPTDTDIAIDRGYILSAAGLLSTFFPDAAFDLMRSELSLERTSRTKLKSR